MAGYTIINSQFSCPENPQRSGYSPYTAPGHSFQTWLSQGNNQHLWSTRREKAARAFPDMFLNNHSFHQPPQLQTSGEGKMMGSVKLLVYRDTSRQNWGRIFSSLAAHRYSIVKSHQAPLIAHINTRTLDTWGLFGSC